MKLLRFIKSLLADLLGEGESKPVIAGLPGFLVAVCVDGQLEGEGGAGEGSGGRPGEPAVAPVIVGQRHPVRGAEDVPGLGAAGNIRGQVHNTRKSLQHG